MKSAIQKAVFLVFCSLIISEINPQNVFAVVGKAEKYDEFEEQKLNEFHEQLLREEMSFQDQKERERKMEELLKQEQEIRDKQKKQGKNKLSETDRQTAKDINYELEKMKMDILSLPKRKRVQYELKGNYKYSSNVAREQIGRDNGDTMLESRGGINIDLSGKKTDLRFTLDGGRKWNIERDENDMSEIHESLNYRRKYFKKVLHSLQTKMGRVNTKSPEINKDKLRWDFGANSAYNFPFTRKFSANTSFGFDKRLFPQEAFDQDSDWQFTSFPSLFWNFTPKSRVSLGYQLGINRIRAKTSDTNAHSVHLGYFGRVTPKSSLSFDLSGGIQTPQSLESPDTKTLNTGLGYIWQWTGKTQLTFQLIRSIQNTTSELVSGLADEGDHETTKKDIYYTNNSFSVSLNSRLTRKLTVRGTTGINVYTNKTHQAGMFSNDNTLEDNETMQVTFPFQTDFTYEINRYASLNVGYTFGYRMADEKPDSYHVHEIDASLRLIA